MGKPGRRAKGRTLDHARGVTLSNSKIKANGNRIEVGKGDRKSVDETAEAGCCSPYPGALRSPAQKCRKPPDAKVMAGLFYGEPTSLCLYSAAKIPNVHAL